jgi:hypothetical protein
MTALGDGYLIERELGGGMARVFLGHERALDRRVVVAIPRCQSCSLT